MLEQERITPELRSHHASGVLHAQEWTAQVHRHGEVVFLGERRCDGPDRTDDSRVGKHAVEPTELGNGAIHRRFDRRFVSHVRVLIERPVSDFRRHPPTAILLHVGDQHARALACEQARGRLAEPARPTGHDGDMVLKSSGHVSPLPPWRTLSDSRPR
jgi:hypothetical protein